MKDFIWTDEHKIKFAANVLNGVYTKHLTVEEAKQQYVKQTVASPTISDAVINSIEALKYNNVWQWGAYPNNAAECYTDKRSWIELRHIKDGHPIFRVSNGKESFQKEDEAICGDVTGVIKGFHIDGNELKATLYLGLPRFVKVSDLRKVSKPILINIDDVVKALDNSIIGHYKKAGLPNEYNCFINTLKSKHQ